jgi:hypothetical protein
MTAHTKPGRHWPGFFIFILVVACLASVPMAQAQVQASSDYLARMDADRDGRVSLSEYQDWLCYAFDAMDRNHDGVLVAAELPAAAAPARPANSTVRDWPTPSAARTATATASSTPANSPPRRADQIDL